MNDIMYGPMLRGREAFTGTGADYGKAALRGGAGGARARTTRRASGARSRSSSATTTVPAGAYSLFIEPNSPTQWTFIVSSFAKAPFGAPVSEGLYGAFNYTREKVARAPMRVDALPYQVEQLTWEFTDMTARGGRMSIFWDRTMGSVPFTFGPLKPPANVFRTDSARLRQR